MIKMSEFVDWHRILFNEMIQSIIDDFEKDMGINEYLVKQLISESFEEPK